jgi:hypothetical protein
LLYPLLQLIAYLLPIIRKDKGVDMRPIADIKKDREWDQERIRLRNQAIRDLNLPPDPF